MAIQLGYDLIKQIFVDTVMFDISWLVSLIVVTLTLLVITRDTQKWKELAFPVMIGWHVAGVPPFFLMYIATAILFAIETLSLQTITQLLSVKAIIKPKKKTIIEKITEKRQYAELKPEIELYSKSKGKLGLLSRKELKEIRRKGLGRR